jgi:hypothetical protein
MGFANVVDGQENLNLEEEITYANYECQSPIEIMQVFDAKVQ